jgi:hypothetical protein
MLGKVREAVADAAETLRRLFADPAVREAPVDSLIAVPRTFSRLACGGLPGLGTLTAETRSMPGLAESLALRELPRLQATLQSEAGWAHWGSEAQVVVMTPLRGGGAARVEVPPLPPRPVCRGVQDPIRPPTARRAWDLLKEGRVRRLEAGLGSVPVRAGLSFMLARPVPIQGEDIQRLPKGLWMRYSLQMVRATGENVRNLEVLGLFRLPRKGVSELRHDPRRGRILVRLGAEAAGSPRVPFILARRRSDGALLSCYLEEP